MPHTLSQDGDPIDVLVANTRPIFPGAIINVRPIGVLKMVDDGGTEEKIITVPTLKLTQHYEHVRDYTDPCSMTTNARDSVDCVKNLEGETMNRREWGRSGLIILVLLVLAILVAQSRRNCEVPGSSWVPCIWGEPLKHQPQAVP